MTASVHTVRDGESVDSIARMHNLDALAIVIANPERQWIEDDDGSIAFAIPIFVGEDLHVPCCESCASSGTSCAPCEVGTMGDDAPAPTEPTDDDLKSFGFSPDQIASPADRVAAAKAYNDARIAMAEAKAGKTVNALTSGVGVAVALLALTPTGWGLAAAAPLLAGFWAGTLAAFKGLQAAFGTAHAGPGQWTEWCTNTPPIDENDPNWWHADTGYAAALAKYGRGADTPWTRNLLGQGWPREPEMHGFGPIDARVAKVDPRAQPFARFALPLLYRAYELTMNCRNWSKIGDTSYANVPADFGMTESGTFIPNPWDTVLGIWNSQHAGPTVGIQNKNDAFPILPDGKWFNLNVGQMTTGPAVSANDGETHPAVKVAVGAGVVAAIAAIVWAALGKPFTFAAIKHAFKSAERTQRPHPALRAHEEKEE